MYGSLADWRAYALERGNSAPTDASDTDASAALVRASDYIKYRYVANLLPGYDESLAVVEYATYEAALLELGTPGFFTKTYTEAEKKVLTEVKGIKWTVTGSSSSVFANAPSSSLIEAMFDPYISDDTAPYAIFMSVGPSSGC